MWHCHTGCCSFFFQQTSLKKDLCGGFENTSSNLKEIILLFSKDFVKLCDETKQSHSASILIKLFYPILWRNMILTCYKMQILQPLIFLFKINFWQHNTAANLLSSRYSVVMRDRKKTHTQAFMNFMLKVNIYSKVCDTARREMYKKSKQDEMEECWNQHGHFLGRLWYKLFRQEFFVFFASEPITIDLIANQ